MTDLELFEDIVAASLRFTARASDTMHMCLTEYQMDLGDFKNASTGSWPNMSKKDICQR